MKKETICWGCKNYAKCSWNKGIPVEGWDAEPTSFYDRYKGDTRLVRSYCVKACPMFEADDEIEEVYPKKIRLAELAEIAGVAVRTAGRWTETKEGRARFQRYLRPYGLALVRVRVKSRHTFHLIPIEYLMLLKDAEL